jgi:hypothetical protein
MISGRTRYLIHTVVGCLAYPTIVVVLVKSIYEALVSGVTTGKRFVCHADADAVCYTSSLLVLAVFVVFFSAGSFASWSDLFSGRREPDVKKSNFLDIFRSQYLVRRSWVAVMFAVIALSVLALSKLIP